MATSAPSPAAVIERHDTGPRYSEIVVHRYPGGGGTVYLAGQVPTSECEGKDMAVQTQSVLDQIQDALVRVGSDKTKILNAQIFIVDIADLPALNAAWEAWMPAGYAPARTSVGGIALARPGWKLEIVVTAAL